MHPRITALAAFLALPGCAVTKLTCPAGLGQGCTAWSIRLLVGQTLVLVDGQRELATTNEPRDLPELPGLSRPEPKPKPRRG